MQEVYKSEWVEWKKSPTTRGLLVLLSNYRKDKLEAIAQGHARGLEELYIEIGRVQGIEDCLHFLSTDAGSVVIDDSEVLDDIQSEGSGISGVGQTGPY